ncbi:peptidase domain-containing ABC transporter, partial [bacterium]|nr:peptidase domain-containing ABC transporter [bacterium]
MRYVQQLDEADCGAACISMILSYYNISKSVTRVREVASTDTMGTNLLGMINAFQAFGFTAKGLKGERDAISSELPVPFIAHINKEINGNRFHHYVVIKKITKKFIYIWDPDSNKKKYKLNKDDFNKIWTGYVIFVSPNKEIEGIKKTNTKLLYKFLPLIKPYKKLLIYACLSSILIVVFGIVSTFYTRYVIDEVLFSHAKFTLLTISLGMIFVVIFKAIVEAMRKIFLTHFAYKINIQLVFTYFTHVFKLPLRFFDSRKTGEIISRMQDISKIQQVLSQALISIVMDVALVIVVIPILYATNNYLFFIIVLTVPFSALCLYIYSKIYNRQYKKMMSSASDLQSFLVESINGSYTVKAMACENFVLKGYEKYQMAMTNSAWKTSHYTIYQEFASELIKQLSSIIVFWVGSYLIIEGKLSVGTLISFTSLSAYFSNPIERLVNTQSTLQEAFVAADRLGEILELEIEQTNQQGLKEIEEIKGNIVFNNVAFRYGSRNFV